MANFGILLEYWFGGLGGGGRRQALVRVSDFADYRTRVS